MIDVIFRNATVVDGSGRPAFRDDVGISDGKIVMNCRGEKAASEVDASGKMLCPGFIDSHSHMDRWLGERDEISVLCKVSQGITSEVTSQCGSSEFPEKEIDAFFNWADQVPKVINPAFLIGHSSVRKKVMDLRGTAPTETEMREMKGYVRKAMERGCLGMSSGLIYIPGVYSTTEELIELAKEVAPYHGVYATHMRSESDHIVEAVEEAISVAIAAKIPLFISHHKIVGRQNWGKSKETLALVHRAIESGLQVTMDQYPYEASQSNLNTSIPPSYFTEGYERLTEKLKDPETRETIKTMMTAEPTTYNCGYRNAGGFEGIVVVSAPETPDIEGKSVAQYASEIGKDAFDTYLDVLAENKGKGGACYFCISPDEIETIYLDENTVVGSDSDFYSADGPVHPRAFGALVRSLTYFCKEKKVISFEKAIQKQTGLTAQRWGIRNKGLIENGFDADLVLLDYDDLEDTATYVSPRQYAKGIEQVYVNGTLVYAYGALTGAHPGACIYGAGRL